LWVFPETGLQVANTRHLKASLLPFYPFQQTFIQVNRHKAQVPLEKATVVIDDTPDDGVDSFELFLPAFSNRSPIVSMKRRPFITLRNVVKKGCRTSHAVPHFPNRPSSLVKYSS